MNFYRNCAPAASIYSGIGESHRLAQGRRPHRGPTAPTHRKETTDMSAKGSATTAIERYSQPETEPIIAKLKLKSLAELDTLFGDEPE